MREPVNRVFPDAFDETEANRLSSDIGRLACMGLDAAANSDEYFDPGEVAMLETDLFIEFNSPFVSGWPINDTVQCRIVRAPEPRRMALIVPPWTADPSKWERLAHILANQHVTSIVLTPPLHGSRTIDARTSFEMVSDDLYFTLTMMRQAVKDARAVCRWMSTSSNLPVAVIGASLGSAIGSLTTAHEPAVDRMVCFHATGLFADTIWFGDATGHVRRSLLSRDVDLATVQKVWAALNPAAYVERLSERQVKTLIVSGRYDGTIRFMFTNELTERLRLKRVPHRHVKLPCGHNSMGWPPFNLIALHVALRWLGPDTD